MVVTMEAGRRNLHPSSHHQSQPILRVFAQFDLANYHPWSQKDLTLTVIGPAMIVAGVRFHFRPEILSYFVLRGRIPLDCPANLRHGTGRQHPTQGGLDVELTEPFAECHRGSYRRRCGPVLVASRRH